MNRFPAVLLGIIAALLGAVATLKLNAALRDPMIDLATGWPRPLIWAVGYLELGAACALFWLIAHGRLRAAWLAESLLTAVFISFTAFRLVQSPNLPCACFGSTRVSESAVMAGLFLVAATLLVCRMLLPREGLREALRLKGLVTPSTFGVAFGLALFGTAVAGALSTQLRTRVVAQLGLAEVTARDVTFDQLPTGKLGTVQVTLVNHSESPIEVVGAKNSCSCFSIARNRFKIAPASAETVDIEIYSRNVGPFRQRLTFFLVGGHQRVVDVHLFGTLVEEKI
ncbi:MAG: DUF1573 domain-containing protein [Planctomycetales bacterium]|nr:DUF1573 domain-containing protein [Planctomycetales bacterium]